MKLEDTEECKKCLGAGIIKKSIGTIHSLPNNLSANAMYSDKELYNLTIDEFPCSNCDGQGYIPIKK